MSRFLIALSLASSLTSFTSFAAAEQSFSQPPSAVAPADPVESRMMPKLDFYMLRAKLAANRAANLARFRAYQKAGVFPSNTYTDSKLNVWHDAAGHFCAAATIIRMSGQTALVDKVADVDNFIRLADVKQGPLMDWILTSGLTQDEIAAIQEPMMPVSERPVVDPEIPVPVSAKMRATEDARLKAKYKQVEAQLVKNEQASLDLAVDRLMAHSRLAWQLQREGSRTTRD
jgi:hypothetical protein